MRIVNVMFGRGLGGIEQAFLDYSCGLRTQGHELIALIHPKAAIIEKVKRSNDQVVTVKNYGGWDILAKRRLAKILSSLAADVIIVHGNRAAALVQPVAHGLAIPVIGVCHNGSVKQLAYCDALFTVNGHIARNVVDITAHNTTITVMPNMITDSLENVVSSFASQQPYRKPPIIGTMGRLVDKKAFHILLHAVHLLKQRGVMLSLMIAGDGEKEKELKALSKTLDIENQVKFLGWIEDKSAFFDKIDLFCLPSLDEAFGIVILEAFLHHTPVITSDAIGPSEIVTHGKDAWVVKRNDSEAFAEAIEQLLQDQTLAQQLVTTGFETLRKHYHIENVSHMMSNEVRKVVENFNITAQRKNG